MKVERVWNASCSRRNRLENRHRSAKQASIQSSCTLHSRSDKTVYTDVIQQIQELQATLEKQREEARVQLRQSVSDSGSGGVRDDWTIGDSGEVSTSLLGLVVARQR